MPVITIDPTSAEAAEAAARADRLLLARVDNRDSASVVLGQIMSEVADDEVATGYLLVALTTITTSVLQGWSAYVREVGAIPPPMQMVAEDVLRKMREQGITV